MRYLLYGTMVLFLLSGCVRQVRHIPVETAAPVERNVTTHRTTGTLYDTSKTEAKYNLKPEPYSVGSNEKDPELLGPQRTIEPTRITTADTGSAVETEEAAPQTAAPQTTAPQTVASNTTSGLSTTMSKSECISMIGQAKFDRYTKRFGGESGAIKRCAILKKLKG